MMRKLRIKRENRFLPAMFAVLMAAVLLAMFFYQNAVMTRARSRAKQELSAAAGRDGDAFLSALEWQYFSLETIAVGLFTAWEEEPEALAERLSLFLEQTDFIDIYIAAADGSSVAKGHAINIADRRYFQEAINGRRGLEVIVSRFDGEPRLVISVPVFIGDTAAYVLYAACREEALAQMLRESAKDQASYSLVCAADGERIIGGNGGSVVQEGNLFDDLARAMDDEALLMMRADFASGRPGVVSYTLEGVETYLAYVPLPLNGWMVLSAMPWASVNEEAMQAVRSGYLLIGAVVLSSTAFVLLFTWTLRRSSMRLLREQARLNESDARCRMAIEATSFMLWDYDVRTRTMVLDERSRGLMGLESLVLENVPESLIASGYICPESANEARALHERLFAGEAAVAGVCRVRAQQSGERRYLRIRYTNLFDEKGAPYLAVGMGEDVTGEWLDKQKIDALSLAAERDAMTGLFHHDATIGHIAHYLRTEGAALTHALFMIDIDDFKRVNDTHGHLRGDETIKRIAGTLRREFRATDIAGRVGGEEFLVLMKNVPDLSFVEKKAQEIVLALRIADEGEGGAAPVTVSVGVAVCHGNERPFEELYALSDAALYRAKRAGKGRYALGR